MNAIELKNVSKKFKKGERHDSLRDLIPSVLKSPFRKKADKNELEKNEFWALKDINFELKRGEALGIIGPNGAGKSTILKILSSIHRPTSGEININGRLSALIEVGAGFHQDLTGRENIYLAGAIMGMPRKEIDAKYQSIVDFAELHDFIDTPVKRYSSGMYVRLGFAVAAHMDPEILLIDEVLAVGDMSFQTKCLDKIREFVESGKTIIFISHQLHQVEKLCDRVILLMEGKSVYDGDANSAIDLYRAKALKGKAGTKEKNGSGEIVIADVQILGEENRSIESIKTGDKITFRVSYDAKEPVIDPIFSIVIYSPENIIACHMRTDADNVALGQIQGNGHIDLSVEALNLLPNTYIYSVVIMKQGGIAVYDAQYRSHKFLVSGGHKVYGLCHLDHKWRNTPLNVPVLQEVLD